MVRKTLVGTCLGLALLGSCFAGTEERMLTVGPRFSWTPRKYSLELNESKKIPVHPDEASFLSGETEVKADSSSDFSVFGLGIESKLRANKLRLLIGADAEFDLLENEVNYYGGKHDRGMYDTKQQISDTRPSSDASFVYDSLEPKSVSIIPFLGAGIDLGKFNFDLEYHFAKREFERDWGYHRFDKEQSIGKESYTAKGNRFAIKLTTIEDKGVSGGIVFTKEDYSLEGREGKAGNISSYSIGIVAGKTF